MQRFASGTRRCRAPRQRAGRAAPARDVRLHHPAQPVAIGHYVGILAPKMRRSGTRSTTCCAARCATARSSASSGSGTYGTRTSRNFMQAAWPARTCRPTLTPGTIRGSTPLRGLPRCRDGGCAALLSLAAEGVGVTIVLSCLSMGLAVVLGVLIATGRVWQPPAPARARRLRRVDARDADPAAALRSLLRHCGGDPIAGVCGSAARAGPQLRRVRERDLSLGARGGLARSDRSGANARIERTPGSQAGSRAAGVPAGARTYDQRFRRAAQGFVACVGPDGAGAHERNADLRDEPRQLGRSRHDVRGPLSGDVVAGRRCGAPAGAPLEFCNVQAIPFCACATCNSVAAIGNSRRRVARCQSRRTVAIMGPAGSGKTTLLRAIAGLERSGGTHRPRRRRSADRRQRIPAAPLPPVGMVFQFHCLRASVGARQRLSRAGAYGVAARVPNGALTGCSAPSASSTVCRRCPQPFRRRARRGDPRALAVDPPVC